MRKLFIIVFFMIFFHYSFAHAKTQLKVVTSIKPVHSLVSAVMDGVARPELMVDGANSPHNFTLKPSQAQNLQDADIVFWIGPDLEGFLEKSLVSIAPDVISVKLINAPEILLKPYRSERAFEEANIHEHEIKHHDDHEHKPGEVDIHIWLDPKNAIAMVKDITRSLTRLDPDNGEKYQINSRKTITRLEDLTKKISRELESVHDQKFILFHDGYQYFENRFELAASGVITVLSELKPGAKRMADLRDKIIKYADLKGGAICIFSEPQFDPEFLNSLTNGLEVRFGELDPIGAGIKNGPELYFSLMNNMSKSFYDCLGR